MSTDHEGPVGAYPDWYAALPVTIAAAGVLFFDDDAQVMLVRTTYKDDWDIPGGVIEVNHGETPLETARREVAEELGLEVEIGRLMAIDVIPASTDRRPLIAFIFDGGTLNADELAKIQFLDNEIAETRFCAPSEIDALTLPPLARRLRASISARSATETGPVFLSNGR